MEGLTYKHTGFFTHSSPFLSWPQIVCYWLSSTRQHPSISPYREPILDSIRNPISIISPSLFMSQRIGLHIGPIPCRAVRYSGINPPQSDLTSNLTTLQTSESDGRRSPVHKRTRTFYCPVVQETTQRDRVIWDVSDYSLSELELQAIIFPQVTSDGSSTASSDICVFSFGANRLNY